MTAESMSQQLVATPTWRDEAVAPSAATPFGTAWDPRRVMPIAAAGLGLATTVLVALTAAGEVAGEFAYRDVVGLVIAYSIALAIVARAPWTSVPADWLVAISAIQVLFVVSLTTMTGGGTSPYFALYAPLLALAGWHLRLGQVTVVVAMVAGTETWRALVLESGPPSDQLTVALPLYATVAVLANLVAGRLTGAIVTIRRDQAVTAETLVALRALSARRDGDLLIALAAEARRIHACDARAVAFDPPTPGGDPMVADSEGGRRLSVTVSGPSATYGLLEVERQRPFTPSEARLLAILADAWGRALDARHLFDELRNQTKRDPLTGLLNRRALDDDLSGRVRRALDERTPVVIAYVDIDGLKGVNDTHGHEVGDRMIREVARQLATATRDTERVYRVGGDEFVVVAVDVDPETAPRLAARLTAAARTARRRSSDRPDGPRVTLSVGVIVADSPDVDPAILVKRADAAMYRAKERGGDDAEISGAATRER